MIEEGTFALREIRGDLNGLKSFFWASTRRLFNEVRGVAGGLETACNPGRGGGDCSVYMRQPCYRNASVPYLQYDAIGFG